MTFSHSDFEYIDMHTHFFPPPIFEAIWDFFEKPDQYGNPQGWNIYYKWSIEKLVKHLEDKNVKFYTTLNYAHNKGVAEYINNWTIDFCKTHKNAIPFGCIWPEDDHIIEHVRNLFLDHEFEGIKVQPLVQNFYPYDSRLFEVYKMIVALDKWYVIHAGTAPYANQYVGHKNFVKLIEKFPTMNIIIAHLGAFEYKEFFSLLDKYDNLYLDTSMVFIPRKIFHKWERDLKYPNPEDLLSYQDRILYGSDYPNIPFDYELSTKGLLELNLPKSFYKKIFYENAMRLFNLNI